MNKLDCNTCHLNCYKCKEKMIKQHEKELREQKENLKEEVKDWRRGMQMYYKEVDTLEKAHVQILKILTNL